MTYKTESPVVTGIINASKSFVDLPYSGELAYIIINKDGLIKKTDPSIYGKPLYDYMKQDQFNKLRVDVNVVEPHQKVKKGDRIEFEGIINDKYTLSIFYSMIINE